MGSSKFPQIAVNQDACLKVPGAGWTCVLETPGISVMVLQGLGQYRDGVQARTHRWSFSSPIKHQKLGFGNHPRESWVSPG